MSAMGPAYAWYVSDPGLRGSVGLLVLARGVKRIVLLDEGTTTGYNTQYRQAANQSGSAKPPGKKAAGADS